MHLTDIDPIVQCPLALENVFPESQPPAVARVSVRGRDGVGRALVEVAGEEGGEAARGRGADLD